MSVITDVFSQYSFVVVLLYGGESMVQDHFRFTRQIFEDVSLESSQYEWFQY